MKKPTIINIDGSAFLVPDNKGLQTLLNLFAGAVRLTRRQFIDLAEFGEEGYCFQYTLGDEVAIETESVGKKTRFVTKEGACVDVRKSVAQAALKPARPLKQLAAGPRRQQLQLGV
ncbi:MAG TPA: hypothetical protein VGO11_19850 [Chthoniobacteraceae bacterium]|jgi:hypothetical protein|nr:hypothetical protein [Chthoniobacteraceae bacterium]